MMLLTVAPVATRMNVPAGGTGPVFPWITLRAIALPRPDVLMMLIAAKEALCHLLPRPRGSPREGRSEEHTSELQSLMRISYAVFCLKKKKKTCNILMTQPSLYITNKRTD